MTYHDHTRLAAAATGLLTLLLGLGMWTARTSLADAATRTRTREALLARLDTMERQHGDLMKARDRATALAAVGGDLDTPFAALPGAPQISRSATPAGTQWTEERRVVAWTEADPAVVLPALFELGHARPPWTLEQIEVTGVARDRVHTQIRATLRTFRPATGTAR